MFSEGDCNNTMEQLPWLIVSCPPGGEDLLWGFREHLKKSQVECSSSSRVLDETLSLLSPVVCAGLLQRSWKALGKTAWFSARAQLQNLGAFCSSCASGAPLGHWSKSATVQISSHDHGHGFIWFQDGGGGGGGGVCSRGCRKRLWGSSLSALPISSAPFSITRGELDLQLSSSYPHPPWLDQPPTRPSCFPLQMRPLGQQQCRLGAGDGWVGMTECSVLLIHQALLWSRLDKHREKYNQLSTKFQNLLHFN